MNKKLVIAALFLIGIVFVMGCTQSTGYGAYGQGGQGQQQQYVGGGCGVTSPADIEDESVSGTLSVLEENSLL